MSTTNNENQQLRQTAVSSDLCACGSSEIKKTFIQSDKWLGSSSSRMRGYSRNDHRFYTREYSLGFDFYANGDLLHTECKKCGRTDFISV